MAKSAFRVRRSEDSLGFLLWQTTVVWQRVIKKALDPYDISHAQFVILAISLWAYETRQTLSQAYLIEQSKLDKMTVSQALKKLAAEGLIKRQEHQTDTRAKILSLTAKGQALAKKLVPIVEGVDEQFFAKLYGKERAVFLKSLNKVVS